MRRSRIVIVGGGISGLATAYDLIRAQPDLDVTVLDASDRPGGKLRQEQIAGCDIDVGAESMLARRPEGVELVERLGWGDEIAYPATTSAGVLSRGAIRPLPSGTLMGVPSDPWSALGLLSQSEVERAADEQPWTDELGDDVAVGDYIAARLGQAVVDRLVEPLLGGVYAGHASRLSLRATVPALWEAALRAESLTQRASSAAAAANSDGAPVFAGLRGGVGRLPSLLADDLVARGVVLRQGAIARELIRETDGIWSIVIGPRPAPERIVADAVVLATPATPTARLLAPHAPAASADLSAIEYASMAIVTLAVERSSELSLPGSGFLVPPVEGRVIKASTFTSQKWEWAADLSPGAVFLRASVGRAGEVADLHRDDAELVEIAAREVGEALGRSLPRLVDSHVQRWGGGLPQYAVGHLGRVERIREDVARLPALELAGAAYEGVGIPACIASGQRAAAAVLTRLRETAAATGE